MGPETAGRNAGGTAGRGAAAPLGSGAAAPTAGGKSATVAGKGLDIGTANLVGACRNADGSIRITLERNAFLDVQADVFSKSMLTKLGVPYVVHEGKLIVLGEPAFELANIFGRETRRPMKGGLVSPNEVDAAPVMRMLIQKILGPPHAAGETLYFSVPAESIDCDNNIVYHRGLFEGLLSRMGYTPHAIGEGHSVVFCELADKDFTGIGMSFGGGMVNVCVAYKTIPALAFSIARGGDWIDKNVADVLGTPRSRATYLKERGVDLTNPRGREEEAIAIYYHNLIAYILQNLKARFESSEGMPTLHEPVDIVCSGGTALIGGFVEVFREEMGKLKFPFPVGRCVLAAEPLNSVAKGCLVAAAIGE
ncbi:MAG TPA: cell division protein FtsA [Planctomycetota bacterium]|nr:cell division protein FtsA [Planctomycetota bacterium]